MLREFDERACSIGDLHVIGSLLTAAVGLPVIPPVEAVSDSPQGAFRSRASTDTMESLRWRRGWRYTKYPLARWAERSSTPTAWVSKSHRHLHATTAAEKSGEGSAASTPSNEPPALAWEARRQASEREQHDDLRRPSLRATRRARVSDLPFDRRWSCDDRANAESVTERDYSECGPKLNRSSASTHPIC